MQSVEFLTVFSNPLIKWRQETGNEMSKGKTQIICNWKLKKMRCLISAGVAVANNERVTH